VPTPSGYLGHRYHTVDELSVVGGTMPAGA